MQTLTFVSEQRPANGNKTKQVYVAEFVTSDINTLQFAAATDSRIPNKSSLDIYARIDADLPWVHVKSYIPLPSAFLQTFDIPAGLQVRIESSEPGISATVVTATAPSGGSSSSGSGITPEQMQQITEAINSANQAAVAARSAAQEAITAAAQIGPKLDDIEQATEAANQAATNATNAVRNLPTLVEQKIAEKIKDIPTLFDKDAADLLCTILRNMAFATTPEGQNAALTLINKFESATSNIVSISATWVGGSVYVGHTIKPSDIKVMATDTDGITTEVSGYMSDTTTLRDTSNTITLTYKGKTTTIVVSATRNVPTAIINCSTTQTNANEGDEVDKSAITYGIRYANGTEAETSDPNIINVSPTTLAEGDNVIVVSLVDYPSVSTTITINAIGEEVTSQSVTLPKASYIDQSTGSKTDRPTVLKIELPKSMAKPSTITIEDVDGSTSAALAIKRGTITNVQGEWAANILYGVNSSYKDLPATISFEPSGDKVTSVTIGPIVVGSNNLQFRTGDISYKFKFDV